MPFSPERTDLIKTRIAEQLDSGQSNEWERSFLDNMAARFNQNGTKTRLTDAQFKTLHRLLKLNSSDQAQPPRNRTAPSVHAQTSRSARPRTSRGSPMSIGQAITAPRRAVRQAQKQVMLPIVLILGFFALVGFLLDTASLGSSTYDPQVTSIPQSSSGIVAYVTGSRVNQRQGPSTSANVMGVLTEGTRVRAISRQGDWTQITSMLGEGWMASSFLSSRETPLASTPSQGRALRTSDVRVIDGDTVDVTGQDANVRLVGFNAPETWRPSCNAELEVGQRATARLRQLVREARSIEFRQVACSCRAGTEGTDQCNFGRRCGSLFVDGVDVGATLIGEGLAVAYRCSRTSCPPRPQVWCR